MHRLAAFALLALASCGTRVPPPVAPPRFGGFDTQEQRESACLDLQDHAVDIYARTYAVEQRLEMMPAEQFRAFRDAWANELAKRGSFEHFQRVCFASLTPTIWACAMQSDRPDGITLCQTYGR